MGTYYADIARADNTGDGLSWANAKKNVANAMALATAAGGGHLVLVAPGYYAEKGITPSVVGATGSINELRGDYDGSNGSGKTGVIAIDATTLSGSDYAESTSLLSVSDNWDYWKINGLALMGTGGGNYCMDLSPSTGGQTLNSLQVVNCLVGCIGSGGSYAFRCYDWTMASDTNGIIDVSNCIFSSYGGAFVGYRKSTALHTNHPAIFTGCLLLGFYGAPLMVYGPDTSHYTRVKIIDCTLGMSGSSINYSSRFYTAVTNQRSILMGPLSSSSASITVVDLGYCYNGAISSHTSVTKYPYFPFVTYLGSWSDMIGLATTATSPTPSTDVFGQTRPNGTYRDIGSQEWYTDPEMPTLGLGDGAAPAAGGRPEIRGGNL